MANCLGQPRSARQMVCSNRPKVGVGSHSHGHFPEQPKTFLPTNVGTADAMGRVFVRKEKAFAVNSRAGRSQLLRWTLDQKKTRPVTGKRIRRRQDMRSAPVGPAGGMRNVSTEQASRFIARTACNKSDRRMTLIAHIVALTTLTDGSRPRGWGLTIWRPSPGGAS